MRRIKWALLLSTIAVLIPATANATVRTAHINDPQGDTKVLSGPDIDYKSIDVKYDDVSGKLEATWTFYTDIRNEAPKNDWAYASGQEYFSGPYTQGHNDSLQMSWNITGAQDSVCDEESRTSATPS